MGDVGGTRPTCAGPIAIRRAGDADADFLLEVHAGVQRAELSLAGLDASELEAFLSLQFQLQRRHYRVRYPGADHGILIADGVAVGCQTVWRGELEIVLVNFALLPEYRGRGIGTHCLEQLTREAAERRVRVRLSVRPENRARYLYRRMGFRELCPDGANIAMEWSAPGSSRANGLCAFT